jgi:hypothetical protein
MTTLVLNYINRHYFLNMKDLLNNAMVGDQSQETVAKAQSLEESTYLQVAAHCKCCGWKGKFAQTQKNYFFHAAIAEIEFFCPNCSTYLGFISDKH